MNRKIRVGTAVIACLVCAAAACLATVTAVIWRFGGEELWREAGKYAAVRRAIEETYVGDVDARALSDASSRALVETLGDRWSYYMTAEEYEAYRQHSANRYTGVGVTVVRTEEGFAVTGVAPGSPAEQAGVAVGDAILSVDGRSAAELSLAELKAIITDKYGGTVLLELRGSDGGVHSVSVLCGDVYTDPVSWELLSDGVGYVRIRNFEDGSGDGAVAAVDALLSQGARALVFDVRANPGGKVSQLLKILDRLLPEGTLFVSVSRAGEESVDRSDALCVTVPMAVLMDENSYSAAEFFAAALWEYDAAITVGAHTTGKGRSQVTVELPDGSAVHLSKYKYLTPRRVDLSEQGGLAPDVDCALSDAAKAALAAGTLDRAEDAQLQAALEALAALEAA